jgi:hypothetical protein
VQIKLAVLSQLRQQRANLRVTENDSQQQSQHQNTNPETSQAILNQQVMQHARQLSTAPNHFGQSSSLQQLDPQALQQRNAQIQAQINAKRPQPQKGDVPLNSIRPVFTSLQV